MRTPLLLVAGIFSLLSISCGKDNEDPEKTTNKSRTELLTEKAWKVTAVGLDSDKNGTVDAPFNSVPACELDNTIKFEANGTGLMDEGATRCAAEDPQTSTVAWAFNNGEQILVITGAGDYLSGSTTIKSISDTKLEVYIEGSSFRVYFTLQH